MSKIVLAGTNSGYNLSVINQNFQTLVDVLNTQVLFREDDSGDDNHMSLPLDMNGLNVFNVGSLYANDVFVNGVDISSAVIDAVNETLANAITAENAANAASQSLAQFNLEYLGANPSDPSPVGIPDGALYFNTTTLELKYLRSGVWTSFPQANQVAHTILTRTTDFTTGTTNLTLPATSYTKTVLWVMFDGAYQQPGTYSLTTQTNLNFPAGVGSTVQKIDIAYIAPLASAIIDDLSITTAKLGPSSVTQDKMAANSVGAAQIGAGQVLTAALADASVTTSKLVDNSVTFAKLAADKNPFLSGLSIPRYVGSVAGLRTLSKLGSPQVITTGYYGFGDGGGATYSYAPADTTSADNGGSIIVAADGGRWYYCSFGPMNFRQWGAKGDGVTDDLAAMQGAINSSSPGTKIFLPNGFYRVSNTLTVFGGRSIEGMNAASDVSNGVCQIVGDLSVTIVVATNQIDSTASVSLRKFGINRAPGSFGAGTFGLLVQGSDQQVIEDISIMRHGTALAVQSCLSAYMHRVNTWACTQSHVSLTGCVEPHFYHCRFGRNGNADLPCIQYVAINNGVDTVRFDSCQFNQSGNTVVQCVKWYGYNNANGIFHFNNCHMENWTAAVFVADASTVKIQRLKVINSSITVSGSGAQFYIGASGIIQDSSIMNNNLDVACNFDSHVGLVFSGNNVSGVFSFNSGKYAVSNNVFGGNVTLTGTANHAVFGINSILGTLTNSATGVVVTGNN